MGKGKDRRAFEFSKTQRSTYWRRVYKKHGVLVEFVATDLTEDEALDLEIIEIAKYGRYINGGTLVNLTNGGDGTTGRYLSLKTRGLISTANRGFRHSEETKKKMSESRKGVPKGPFSESHVENLRKAALVRPPISLQTRAKISKANKGYKFDPEVVRKRSEMRKGKSISDETKSKISQSLLGREPVNKGVAHSEETRAKMKEAAKKKPPVSEETRRKMSETRRGKTSKNGTLVEATPPQKKETQYSLSEETRRRMSASRTGVKRGPYKKKTEATTKPKLYMVAACSGSGKSWVCKQLTDKFDYVSYDDTRKKEHLDRLLSPSDKPKLYDPPIKISTFFKRHSDKFDIHAVFILEEDDVVKARVESRGGEWTEHISKRNAAMRKRFDKYGDFAGTSQQVLDYLKGLN